MTYNHIEYFKNLSEKLLLVSHSETNKHFFTASSFQQLEGLITSLSIAQYPAIIAVDKRDGRFNDQLSSNLIDVQFYQVMILMPSRNIDSSNRNAVMNTCFSIFKSIVSKMTVDHIADSRIPISQELTGLRNFNRNDIVYNSMGPIFDNLFGIDFSFTLSVPYDTKYNSNEWKH
jgi:hypothetical protein